MPYQNADSGDSFLVIIALIALVIFVLMLLAAFMIVRSENKTKNETAAEKEPKSHVTAEGHDRLFARDNSKGERTSRQFAIVEAFKARGPAIAASFKTLNWFACCVIAPFAAFLGYDHVERALLSLFQVPAYYYWSAYIFSILSPACLAVAWLRLTGFPWRRALALFILVPLGAFVIWYIVNIMPYWFAN
jgi:hypothetical protein